MYLQRSSARSNSAGLKRTSNIVNGDGHESSHNVFVTLYNEQPGNVSDLALLRNLTAERVCGKIVLHFVLSAYAHTCRDILRSSASSLYLVRCANPGVMKTCLMLL